MFRKALLTTAAAIAMLALSSVARADSFTLTQGGTTTLNFQSPNFAGSNATATFTLSGNTLTVTLTNTSTDNTFVTGLGFNTTPDLTLQTASATNGWTAGAGPGGGLGNFELSAFGNGNPRRLSPGESTTATFVFTTTPSSITFEDMIVHLTSLAETDESEKVPGNGENPIPEPMTMILFGTGLAGIAARARRRRNTKA